MKPVGAVRRIDDLGRIVIPKEFRTAYGIEEGDPIEILGTRRGMILRKYNPGCVFCNEVDPEKLVQPLNGSDHRVCLSCMNKIMESLGLGYLNENNK